MNINSFYAKAMGNMGAIANWPNADVPINALITELIPELCQVRYDYLFRDDPVAMVECTLLVQEYFGVDLIYANTDVYNFEGEAMGAVIEYKPDHCPDFQRNTPFIKDEEDFGKIKYGGPDTGRFPYLIEYCKAFKRYTGLPTFPELSSPWTLACNLYGIDNLIMDTVEDPDFVTEFLRRIVDDFHAPMYRSMNEEVPGFHQLLMGDAFASIPIVTLDIVDQFIKPALERELTSLNLPGFTLLDTAFFGTGKLPRELQDRYIDFIIWANHMFVAMDPDLTDLGLERVRQIATERQALLLAGMDAVFLEFAPLPDVINRVKEIMLVCKNGPSPMMFLFNCFNPRTSIERIFTAMHAARIYGAPDATTETPFEMPEYMTFEQFLKHKMVHNPEGYTFEWLKQSGYSHLR